MSRTKYKYFCAVDMKDDDGNELNVHLELRQQILWVDDDVKVGDRLACYFEEDLSIPELFPKGCIEEIQRTDKFLGDNACVQFFMDTSEVYTFLKTK